MDQLDISASDIRARLARGEDVSTLVPARVLDYIRQHRLYR
jgi:nicotinate-nucleotide adenylyltransferase